MDIQPQQSTASEVTYALQGIDLNLARTEPSHIHIPRPSRVRQAIVAHRDDEARIPVQFAPEEAAQLARGEAA